MSKTNATNLRITYKVYQKVIICELTFDLDFDVRDDLIINYPEILKKQGINLDPCNITVTGKAKCHDFDKFNAILGKKIAESRAKIKMFKFLNRINKFVADRLEEMHREFQCKEVNNLYCCAHENTHLNKLLKKYDLHTSDIYKDASLGEIIEIKE